MKEYIIYLLFLIFFVSGCKVTQKHKLNTENLSEIVLNDFNRKTTIRAIPFTLDYPGNLGMPVIKQKIRKKDFYFVVDTGGSGNLLTSQGIKKIEEIFKKKCDDENIKLGKYNFSMNDTDIYGKNIDGILGYRFLLNFNTVTFDYYKKYIYLNKHINIEKMQPMEIRRKHLYTQLLYDNKTYDALIDTGCNSIFVNRNFIEENFIEDNLMNFHYIDLSVYNTYYKNLKVFSFKYKEWMGEDSVKKAMEESCFLGYAIFKNHILYLDFENLMFGIE